RDAQVLKRAMAAEKRSDDEQNGDETEKHPQRVALACVSDDGSGKTPQHEENNGDRRGHGGEEIRLTSFHSAHRRVTAHERDVGSEHEQSVAVDIPRGHREAGGQRPRGAFNGGRDVPSERRGWTPRSYRRVSFEGQ